MALEENVDIWDIYASYWDPFVSREADEIESESLSRESFRRDVYQRPDR